MSDQPEALRLADEVERPFVEASSWEKDAAAELRRLHAERDALQQIVADYPPIEVELREVSDRAFKAEAEVEALRALLLRIRAWDMMDTATDGAFWRREIDAALKGASDADD